jgi:hypothetical protein
MDVGGLGPYPVERITFGRPSSSGRIFLYFGASLSNSIEGVGGGRSYPGLDEL